MTIQPKISAIEELQTALEGRSIAVVHDWLTGRRGGEKVLEAIADMLPAFDLYCLVQHPGTVPTVENHPQVQSLTSTWLTRSKLTQKRFRLFFPVFNSIAQTLKLNDYDLVISISHCVAKNIRITTPKTCHICYCLSPARYAWDLFDDYWNSSLGVFAGVTRPFAKVVQWHWQKQDRKHNRSVTEFIAISELIQKRIQHCYGRDSGLVYPPVETTEFQAIDQPQAERFLVLSAVRPNKRVEEIIQACVQGGWALDVLGDIDAKKHKALQQSLPDHIRIHGQVSDTMVQQFVPNCRALIHAATEDFGIAPVEAMAAGRPVIGYRHSGLGETVVDGKTGVLFDNPSISGIQHAIERFLTLESQFQSVDCQQQAEQFSRQQFDSQFSQAVLRTFAKHQP